MTERDERLGLLPEEEVPRSLEALEARVRDVLGEEVGVARVDDAVLGARLGRASLAAISPMRS